MIVLASTSSGIFIQTMVNGITLGAVYALVALGYTIVYGIVELINFAHGDVFMWSTAITLVVLNSMHVSTAVYGFTLIGLLLLMIVIGAVVSGTLNVVIERLAYRPLRKAPRLAPLIAAIGVSFILENIAELWLGASGISYPDFFPNGGIVLGDVTIQYIDVVVVVLTVGLMYGLNMLVRSTKMGKAMRATAQDPEAAALMGVDINQTISFAFLVGGVLAGVAGVFYSLVIPVYAYNVGFELGLIAFTAAVLGGIGNITGAMAGGFLIGVIKALATNYLPNGSDLSDAVVFAILVLVLALRPSGLLGQQVPDKV